MFVLLASLAPQTPADDWKVQEAVHLKNIKQVTTDFVRAGEGYFSPDGKTDHLPGRGEGHRQPVLPDLHAWTWRPGKYRRVSPGVGKTTCGFFRPDGKKIIFASSHLDPDAKKHYAEEYKQREEDAEGRQAPPLLSGTSTRTWTSSRPTPTART